MNILQKSTCLFSLAALAVGNAAMALQLSDLQLPLTRTEADNTLSKDYEYRFLEDMSVRRSWKLEGKTVHVDFRITRPEQAICIAVEYNKPVSRKTVHKDIKTLTGGKCHYEKLGTPKKGSNTYGLKNVRGARFRADGAKTDSWVFVEHTNKKQTKCTRLVYYAKKPAQDRFSLGDASSNTGYTAMGSTGASINLTALRDNEEKRRAIKPQPKMASTKGGTTGKTATAATKPTQKEDLSMDITGIPEEQDTTASSDIAFDAVSDADLEDHEETSTLGAELTTEAAANKGFLPEAVSAPVRKILSNAGISVSGMMADALIIALPLLLVLILWCIISAKIRKRRSKKVFDAIVNKKTEKEKQN